MKTLFLTILIICSLILTACPKKSVIEKGADYSYRLAGIIGDMQTTTQEAYRTGKISLDTKNKIQTNLLTASKFGLEFNKELKAVSEKYGGDVTKIPKAEIAALDLYFSQNIITPVLRVIELVGLLSVEQVSYLQTALSALRTAILTISNAFGESSASFQMIGRLENYG